MVKTSPPNARGEGLISGWGAKMVKHLLTMQEIQVPFLVREDPLEKETATCSRILAWEIPWTEEPGGLQSLGFQTIRHD